MSPSDKVIEDCSNYLSEIKEDLSLLDSIDVSSDDIYYGHRFISSNSLEINGADYEEENREDLKKLVNSYEFFNNKE